MAPNTKTFEQRYDEIVFEIEKRRAKWDLAAVSFDDAKQIILIKVWSKYHLFDENKIIKGSRTEFSHWVNSVITRTVYNIWRDHLGIHSRPCVGNIENGYKRCPFNGGEDLCTKTDSGKQCSECPWYRAWEKKKKGQNAVRQTLSLEHHVNEANSIQSDFMDIGDKKAIIDRKMKERLKPLEWKIYKYLIIKGGTEKGAAKLMGFKDKAKTKNGLKPKTYAGYSAILKMRKMFVKVAHKIIEEEGLV